MTKSTNPSGRVLIRIFSVYVINRIIADHNKPNANRCSTGILNFMKTNRSNKQLMLKIFDRLKNVGQVSRCICSGLVEEVGFDITVLP
jgi:hypothetical protein